MNKRYAILIIASLASLAYAPATQNPLKKAAQPKKQAPAQKAPEIDLDTFIDIVATTPALFDTVFDAVEGAGVHKSIVKAIRARDEVLKHLNPLGATTKKYTVLAPTDDVVKLAKATITPADLNNYVIEGEHDINNVENMTTIGGKKLTVTVKQGARHVNGIEVIGSDKAKNGVLYALDGLIK